MTDAGQPRQDQAVSDLPGPDEWPELAEFLRRSAANAHTHAEPDDIERLRARIVPPVTGPGDAAS